MSASDTTAWRRDATVFLASQTLSLLGSSLVQYAILWHLTLETRSGATMTLYTLCAFLPTFLLSPFAGVWADRHDRRMLVAVSDGSIAAATLGLAVALYAGVESMPLLLAVAVIRALGAAVQQPAVGALLPQLVPAESLARVNAINGTIQSVLAFVAPLLGGLLLTFAPLHVVFLVDVATAAVAIAILLFLIDIPPHARAAAGASTSQLHDLLEGLRYIRDHRHLASFFVYVGAFLLLVTPAAFLTALQTARSFGPDVWRLTAIELVFSGGMILGGALLSWWGGFRNRMRTMVAANVAMAAATLGLGLLTQFPLYLAAMGFFGLALPFYNTPSMTLVQEHVEEAFLGRAMSVLTMLFTSLMPLSMLLFGPLADAFPIEWILVASAAGLGLHALWAATSTQLTRAGIPPRLHTPSSTHGTAEVEAGT